MPLSCKIFKRLAETHRVKYLRRTYVLLIGTDIGMTFMLLKLTIYVKVTSKTDPSVLLLGNYSKYIINQIYKDKLQRYSLKYYL